MASLVQPVQPVQPIYINSHKNDYIIIYDRKNIYRVDTLDTLDAWITHDLKQVGFSLIRGK